MAGILKIFDEESLDLTLKSSFPTLNVLKKLDSHIITPNEGLDFGSEIKSKLSFPLVFRRQPEI